MSFNNPVVGGENGELIRASIKSPGFLTLVQGWIIRRDGSAEFNNILIRGGAIVGGSITVGPAGMPQVVIDSDASSGFVEFPTNDPAEVNTAIVEGAILNSGLAFESLALDLRGPSVNASDYAYVRIESENQDGSGTGQSVTLGINGSSNSLKVDGTQITSTGELFVQGSGTADNYPIRVVRGRTNGITTNTNLGAGDTLIANQNSSNTTLENGVAYRVMVQIRAQTNSSPAAGDLQLVNWKIWDGAVGGTQLGTTVQKTVSGDDTRTNAEVFMFVFEYTGTTGSKTINLSGARVAGTVACSATTDNAYFMIVERIGDPGRILNL